MTAVPRAWRGLLTRLRASPLGVKLVLLSAGATVLVVSLTFLALRARVAADVRRVFVRELEASQQSLRQLQDRNLHLLLATSSLVSTSPTVRAALETWRVEANTGLARRADLIATVQRAIETVFADLNSDLLVVTDDSGRVVASVSRAGIPRPSEHLLQLPAVRHALAAETVKPDSSFGVLWNRNVQPAVPLQVGCVAIVLAGYPIGVLVLGERLDRSLPQPGSGAAQSVIAVGDVVAASTLGAATVASAWRPLVRTDASGTQHMRIGNEDYVATSLPLGMAENGQPATLYLMRSLTAALSPITGSLGRSFLFFGVLAVLLAGGGAAVVSRMSLRPLARFVAFVRTRADINAYARFSDGAVSAEISTLTDAYNRLIDFLGRQHAQLDQRSVELAAANEALREQVRERERAQQALREREEQMRQSQKLEALGTLAGGVAHDFNNMLSVIMGFAHFAKQAVPADSQPRVDMEKVLETSERAKELVRQLLAFGRKQVLKSQILDLNQVVGAMESLLRRLISEDIELRIHQANRLSQISGDRGQIEQVLLNLVVNARDAMPTGGTITIETSRVHVDERFANRPDAIAAGPAVLLSVSDTGAGMDAATSQRIFEPFFTTKPQDKGTGLGLATVYGIVRQSGGTITVESEPGKGTTFRIYFPAVPGTGEDAQLPETWEEAATGAETILVAEDDALVREMVRRSLTGSGYRVLEATDGQDALEVAAVHKGPIHLLITDVVMPHVSGRELAERLRAIRSEMRVLFVSGHSDEAIQRHGVLARDSRFLQKPVLPDVLARVVREVLDDVPARSEA